MGHLNKFIPLTFILKKLMREQYIWGLDRARLTNPAANMSS